MNVFITLLGERIYFDHATLDQIYTLWRIVGAQYHFVLLIGVPATTTKELIKLIGF
jgi:hypothetical protein